MWKSALVLVVAVVPAQAQQVTTENYVLEGKRIAVHLHPFLSDEGLAMLRLVGRNRDALALFVPDAARFAAMALAPRDGLVDGGLLADSAVAVADMSGIATARKAALDDCNAARSGGPACVIALEIQPE